MLIWWVDDYLKVWNGIGQHFESTTELLCFVVKVHIMGLAWCHGLRWRQIGRRRKKFDLAHIGCGVKFMNQTHALGNKGASLKQTDNLDRALLNQYLIGLLYKIFEV